MDARVRERLDLTSLLLAAKSTGSVTNGHFRSSRGSCSPVFRHDHANDLAIGAGLVGGVDLCARRAIQWKSPRPAQVDRSPYAYATPAIQTTVEESSPRCDESSPVRKVPAASPSHGEIDRGAYSYALGVKSWRKQRPRERGRQPPDVDISEPGQRGRQCRLSADSNIAHFGGTTTKAFGDFSAKDPGAMHAGEEWSGNPCAEDGNEGLGGQRRRRSGSTSRCTRKSRGRQQSRRSASVPRDGARSVRVAYGGSEVHEYFHRERKSREERLRAKQEERDRDLTFQPNLATTTKYYKHSGRERRLSVRSAPPDGAATASAEHQDREMGQEGAESTVGVGIESGSGGRGRQRFEMLYEDSKARRLRLQDHSLKIPVAYTFQPRLVSNHRVSSRERKRVTEATPRSRQRTGANEKHPPDDDTSSCHRDSDIEQRPSGQFDDTVGEAFREGEERRRGGEEHSSQSPSRTRSSSERVDTDHDQLLSYPERLHRGGEEQRRVWAKRQEAQARLELEGCTFRPRLQVVRFAKHDDDKAQPETGTRATSRRPDECYCGEHDGQAFERLYRSAREARARREAVMMRVRRAEIEGCTFQPLVGVRGLNEARPTTTTKASRLSASATTQAHGKMSVYDRLSEAGREMLRRKAMRDKANPPGCTFKPSVNPYKPKGHARMRATLPPPPSSQAKRTVEDRVRPMPPPPPQSTADDQATSAVYTNRVDKVHGGDCDEDIGGVVPDVSGNADGIERRYVDGHRIGNLRQRVNDQQLLDVHGGANVAEPNGRGPGSARHPPGRKEIVGTRAYTTVASKIPYAYLDVSGLSPRRRRNNSNKSSTRTFHIQREDQAGEASGGASTKSPTKADTARDPPTTQRAHSKRAAVSRSLSVTKSLQKRVEDRLHELGDELQRRRNCSPKHPAIAQQQRQEEKELLECTFVPASFTGTYVRAKARAVPKVVC